MILFTKIAAFVATSFVALFGFFHQPLSGAFNTSISSIGGSVTSVSVTTANGVSGSVATAITTPAISLTLGAITPTSVAVQGTAGAGFETLVGQSSNPTSPAAGTLLIHSSTANGFTRMEQDNEAATNLIYGRDNVFIVKNTSGGTITKGSTAYVTGSTGNVPNIAKAQANSNTTLPSVAVVVDDIANNAFGQVMTVGIISNFDTSAFTVGAPVWVSTTVAGGLTSTRPSGTTNSVQRIGSILVSGVGNGSLLVSVAPAILNMETGTNAATWTARVINATQIVITNNAITASGNAATVPITSGISTVTNNSAATLTITITTASAVDGQLVQVRVLDSSAVAQTITWVNTENGEGTAPILSNGSTTLPKSARFQFNGGTSKWRSLGA